MPLNFVKMHANGDDFVLIDARGRTNPITRELARALGTAGVASVSISWWCSAIAATARRN